MQDLAEVVEEEACVGCFGREADPRDVSLADVLDARGAVHEIVDLPFEDRLEVLLHLAAGNIDDYSQIHVAFGFDFREVGSHDFYLAVGDLVQFRHAEVLEGA